MDEQFHPTFHCVCDYLSMLGLKLIQVKWVPCVKGPISPHRHALDTDRPSRRIMACNELYNIDN